MRSGGNVVASFPIPDAAPPAVREAYDRYDQAAQKWATVAGELEEAEAAVEVAKLKDAGAIAAQYEKDGSLPKDSTRHEREALARVAGLRQLLEAAATAADQAGDAMLGPIAEARESWIAELEPVVAERMEHYQSAIATARAALDDLQTAKASIGWLQSFDPDEARIGRLTRGFQGKGPRAVVENHLGQQFDAGRLLEMAATVGSPTGPERAAARHAEAEAKQADETRNPV